MSYKTDNRPISFRMSYFLLIVVIVFARPSNGLEITVCECEKPTFIGLIDPAVPGYCRDTVENDAQKVIYEVIEQVEPPLTNTGFFWRQWLRKKTITGFFFGGYDTVFSETPYEATPEDCWRLAETKMCGGNEMTVVGHTASFTKAPVGEGVWMDRVVKTLCNCELEKFNVTQDCFNCLIRSPFDILSESAENAKRAICARDIWHMFGTNLLHTRTTVILNSFELKRKGFAILSSIFNSLSKCEKPTHYILIEISCTSFS